MNWTGVDYNARCDKTRQNSFFFPNEKERKFARKRGGGEKGRREGGIINSLSALVYSIFQPYNAIYEY